MGISKRAAVALLVVFVVVSAAVVGVGASSGAPESQAGQLAEGGPLIFLRWDPAVSNSRVSPPREFSQLHAQSATFAVNYLAGGTTDRWGSPCYTWSDDAKAAFNYATGIWGALINSPVPISINACWTELPSIYLGYSGARWDLRTDTQYPMALSNALSGTDQNGATAEMDVAYNRIFAWYYGTDGNPPVDKVDFVSVVLHEIAHGLGFSGSMTKEGALGYWNWKNGDGPPAIYDRFTEEGAGGTGTPLISYGYGTVALGSALTSEDVFFDGANANAANGGSPPKLYAPVEWSQGSSYSHLDYDTYDKDLANCLMVYAMSAGESVHDPGPIALGMLKDVGWTTGEADLSIVKRVANGGVGYEPGDLVTFTLSIENMRGERGRHRYTV